ncbi:MAG: phospho-N-acetylmuramoyl-pentapeptide-transferase [Flavobacteriales bacterium]|nr:phospho-N-acetylmuramoyl-pentapeptide-transferase [Flavobacteriales bacterium]
MLYHLFEYLEEAYQFPGAQVFQYISFRAAMALITSLLISMVFGGSLITKLRKLQIGETVRDLGLEGQMQKQGTPTMGGLIILGGILIPTLLFAQLDNIYVITLLITTVWLGTIGFLDDYIKVFKKNKKGLAGKFKVIGQIGVGLIIGSILYFNDDAGIMHQVEIDGETEWIQSKAMVTTIPFVKNNEFDYEWLVAWMPDGMQEIALLAAFLIIVIFIVTAISNGANMTDGLDGLATGTSAIIGVTLAILAYVSGNTVFADYLNIMYIPDSGELVVYIAAFIGACVGFLWYNSFPAQVFMGDTGSLAIGGIIAVFAIAIRKELLLPIICGIFLAENLSVMMQVGYFKWTKKKYGEGRRIFRMAPLHHHYQKLGYHEAKIVSRIWIVGIMLAVFALVTLKLR